MAERTGAAVYVQLVVRNAQLLLRDHGHHGEGFVHFKEVHIRRPTSRPWLQRLLHGRNGGCGEKGRVRGRGRRGLITLAITFRPSFLATDSRVITKAAAPSEIEEALAAVMVPSLEKAGFRVGILAGSAFQGLFVLRHNVSTPLRVATSTGVISRSKAPLSWAALARVRLRTAKASMLFAGELIAFGGLLGEGAHEATRLVGVLQPV